VRYLFRGLIRETGRPVEGHVEANTEGDACHALSQNGVVTESLIPDPKPLNLADELPKAPQFADALESAFDSSSSQVDFDALTERYQGKKVWVIDRDKIRRRTAQVIDAALALSALHGETHDRTRARINSALEGMFSDNRNLATERNAESIAGVRFNGGMNGGGMNGGGLNGGGLNGGDANGAPPPPPVPPRIAGYTNGNGTAYTNGSNGNAFVGHPGLESQIARMANIVKQAEAALAAVSAAARRGGGGGGGGPRRGSVAKGGKGEEQNSVLLEIFKSNLNLVRGMQEHVTGPVAPEAETVASVEGANPATGASSELAGGDHGGAIEELLPAGAGASDVAG
jgi:hypothetical protein